MSVDRSSGALDIYLAVGPHERPPLYFHHINKTGGTSFRNAVRVALTGTPRLHVPAVRERLVAAGAWPDGFDGFLSDMVDTGRIVAVLSHYTGRIVRKVPRRVVAMVRDPETQLRSAINFRLDKMLARGMPAAEIVRRSANEQMASLLGRSVPMRKPADTARWEKAVDKAVRRFKLFRLERLDDLLDHCRSEYGLDLKVERLKVARYDAEPKIARQIEEEIARTDPIWLDRILYERVAGK